MLIEILRQLMKLADVILEDLECLLMLGADKIDNLLVQKCLCLKGACKAGIAAKGPLEDGHYATIPEHTVAINAITADRICYLDLNSEFQDAALSVAENISVYSVVNSIVDSCEVDKVQISIEGNSGGNFRKNLPLYKFYEKNEDLVLPDENTES